MNTPTTKAAFFSILFTLTASFASAGWDYSPKVDSSVHQYSSGPGLRTGTYLGTWKDGTNLTESVKVFADRIILTRLAGGVGQGKSTAYFKSAPNTYRSSAGYVIFVTTANSFTWSNDEGKNAVGYSKLE